MSTLDISPDLMERTAPAAKDLDWMDKAKCAYVDPDLFFPPDGAYATDATAVCRSCEVRVTCLRYALDHSEEGVWGGFSEDARRRWLGRQYRAGESLVDIIAADDARHYALAEESAELARTAADRNNERARVKSAAARAAIAELERAS